jgi:hypothetical protein
VKTNNLIDAAKQGDTARVRELLAAGALVNAKDRDGRTAVMYAAINGNAAAFHALREAGADLSSRRPFEGDMLHLAAAGGSTEIVRHLLNHGFAPNGSTEETPLSAVLSRKFGQITPLMAAAAAGHADVVQMLIDAGADVNARAGTETAITLAQRMGREVVVGMLQIAGATFPQKDPAKAAAKGFAAAAEKPEFVQLLEKLSQRFRREPKPYKKRKGVFVFFTKKKDQIEPAMDEARAAGFQLVQGRFDAEDGAIMLLAFPTPDPYAVVAACGTNGDNYGTSNADVIAWLRDLEKTHPFVLTECGFDYCAGRFLKPVADAKKLAKRMYEFCPDIVDQGTESVEALAKELEENQTFFFWWD